MKRHVAPTLPFECARDNLRAAAGLAVGDEIIDELDHLIWQSDSDLNAHTEMVPVWYAGSALTYGRGLIKSSASTIV